ncbi:MAG: Veg family protein [Clostridia bacterium]|nr:Veg family protein [Clostridia bacterium]
MRKAGLNIEEVKNKIRDLKGREVALNINRGRKKFDTLNGIIKDVYPSVFTIENQSAQLQTFSYYDVLCGNVIFL